MIQLETRRALVILSVFVVLACAVSWPSSPDEDAYTQLKEEFQQLALKVQQLEMKAENEKAELKATVEKQQQYLQKQQEDVHKLNRRVQKLETDLQEEREERGHCNCVRPEEGTEKAVNKRADDVDPLTVVVSQVSQRMDDVTAEIETLKAREQSLSTAVDTATNSVYIRWGKSSCTGTTQLVYSGIIGGSYYSHSGGATNPLCLPMAPTFSSSTQGAAVTPGYAGLYGAEYETYPEPSHNLDAVCAVCRSPSANTLMIPASTSCHPGWNLEYSGNIMAARPDDGRSGTEFICVDSEMEGRAGSQGSNNDQMVLYYTKNHCGSLPCPPYEEGRVVSCVVCSK